MRLLASLTVIVLFIVFVNFVGQIIVMSDNFHLLKVASYSEFYWQLKELSADPQIFSDPELDLSDEEYLDFKWYSREYESDSITLVVSTNGKDYIVGGSGDWKGRLVGSLEKE